MNSDWRNSADSSPLSLGRRGRFGVPRRPLSASEKRPPWGQARSIPREASGRSCGTFQSIRIGIRPGDGSDLNRRSPARNLRSPISKLDGGGVYLFLPARPFYLGERLLSDDGGGGRAAVLRCSSGFGAPAGEGGRSRTVERGSREIPSAKGALSTRSLERTGAALRGPSAGRASSENRLEKTRITIQLRARASSLARRQPGHGGPSAPGRPRQEREGDGPAERTLGPRPAQGKGAGGDPRSLPASCPGSFSLLGTRPRDGGERAAEEENGLGRGVLRGRLAGCFWSRSPLLRLFSRSPEGLE